ncbi:hypothetical protein AVEN_79284-1 [Araneus ventricosus]|uniref:Uncharacterized protein n=1 Tax=Araneus ventricosus TaxID=182803 RepID=A0A4Y2UHL1_ARAVE|nr:hypothetical protein AVEN_79284-1 [Araneus ventricosus]
MQNRTDELNDSAMFQLDFHKNKEIDLQYPDFVADDYVHGIIKKMQGDFAFLPEIILPFFYDGIHYLLNVSCLCLALHSANDLANLRLMQWDLLYSFYLPSILERFLFQR